MPLALELAAARVAVLSPAQIAERLGDALGAARRRQPHRAHAPADAARDAGLEPRPARPSPSACCSAGSACSPAASASRRSRASARGDAATALDLLARLVDKSLVQVEPGAGGHRYRLLETVRQYARERLAAAGERERLEAAHRAWYLALAEAADRDRDPAVAAAWPAERLEAEHDDLRAALASAVAPRPAGGAAPGGALCWFWMARGHFVEGARWLDEALAAAPAPTPERRARARAPPAAIDAALRAGASAQIVALGEEALAIARAARRPPGPSRARSSGYGVMAMGRIDCRGRGAQLRRGARARRGDRRRRRRAWRSRRRRACSRRCRGENAPAREPVRRTSLALLAAIDDDAAPLFWAIADLAGRGPGGPRQARRAASSRTPSACFRAVRSRAATGYALCNVGEAWRSDGEYGAAREPLERALALFRELDDDPGAGVALNALGNLARSTGELEAGRRVARGGARAAPRRSATGARSPRRSRASACSR